MSRWTYFSNHGHVLVCLARDPESRLRDVAAAVGITERAVQKIVRDLQDENVVVVSKQGRRNRYRINTRDSLRHELESQVTVGELISLIESPAKLKRRKALTAAPPPVDPERLAPVISHPRLSELSKPVLAPEPAPTPEPEPDPEPEALAVPKVSLEPRVKQDPEPEPEKEKPAVRKPSSDDQQGSLF